jgi:hypothetical protein
VQEGDTLPAVPSPFFFMGNTGHPISHGDEGKTHLRGSGGNGRWQVHRLDTEQKSHANDRTADLPGVHCDTGARHGVGQIGSQSHSELRHLSGQRGN